MNNIVGLAIFALGVVLLIFGFNESRSFNSDVSRFFTGNPTDRSMWLIAGGGVAVVAGLILAVGGARKNCKIFKISQGGLNHRKANPRDRNPGHSNKQGKL